LWALPAFLTALAYVGLPVLALVWRAGVRVDPPGWSARVVGENLYLVGKGSGALLSCSLVAALMAGLLSAALALLACWAGRDSRAFRNGVLLLMALAWAWPGQVVGLGLKAVMDVLVQGTGSRTLRFLLWNGPSIVPLIWVDLIRFFPCAMALLWPSVRLLPRDLIDGARVDGARPGQELGRVVAPLSLSALVTSTLAVAVLSLGELSASKVAATPDAESFACDVFRKMHYGVKNDLAAQCLLLLLVIVVGASAVALWRVRGRWLPRGDS
jgi:ABC-type Fe3+ transport system permease subunit